MKCGDVIDEVLCGSLQQAASKCVTRSSKVLDLVGKLDGTSV